MKEVQAPHEYDKNMFSVFLAGSIEMGLAEPWQRHVVGLLSNYNIQILNPRRSDWDSSWEQTIDNPEFVRQVDWELQAQENADIIFMHFDEKTKSPITLLELGLFARDQKIIVSCGDDFWRKGNVRIVCDRYNIPRFVGLDEAVELLKIRIETNN